MKLEIGYQSGIIFIVVQKRYYIRFFCVDRKDQIGRSGNISAGIIVDVGIIYFIQFDFYLCSYVGIQVSQFYDIMLEFIISQIFYKIIFFKKYNFWYV